MVNNITIEQFNNEALLTMKHSSNNLLQINPATEKKRITSFIKTVLKKQGFKNVIIGMSGGVDSATSFYLLKEVIPPENIFVAHLYYHGSQFQDIEAFIKKAEIPKNNIYEMSILPIVKAFQSVIPSEAEESHSTMAGEKDPSTRRFAPSVGMTMNRVRLGNIMARIRMIILYDLAKKNNALVCGTENKSEFLLGYFTRFGDQASDFEPIQHLYKTQVYELAKFLGVPEKIIEKTPTAGLWRSQTDEGEFGFSYKEADEVLFYYYDKKLKLEEIKNMGFKNAEKIIAFSLRNNYKHHTPYVIK